MTRPRWAGDAPTVLSAVADSHARVGELCAKDLEMRAAIETMEGRLDDIRRQLDGLAVKGDKGKETGR